MLSQANDHLHMIAGTAYPHILSPITLCTPKAHAHLNLGRSAARPVPITVWSGGACADAMRTSVCASRHCEVWAVANTHC